MTQEILVDGGCPRRRDRGSLNSPNLGLCSTPNATRYSGKEDGRGDDTGAS